VTSYADAQRALDVEREKVTTLEEQLRLANCDQANTEADLNDVTAQLATLQAQLPTEMPGGTILFKECEKGHGRLTATNWIDHGCGTCTVEQLQAQLARWKEVLGEWLWNCTNLLGDYHIKTVQDFNEEVNRRIAWLMQHLDHTLPPPMTDEERDRMRKLSEDNAALQTDNECKDILIESLQAQLEGLEQGCFIHHVDKEQAEMKIALLEGTTGMRATEHIDLLSQLENTEAERDRLQAQLRQVEGELACQKVETNGANDRAQIVYKYYRTAQDELTTLRQLVEVHTKQLTELTIIPIGCSREQELRWTQSIKDLRATLAAKDAGKHLPGLRCGQPAPPHGGAS